MLCFPRCLPEAPGGTLSAISESPPTSGALGAATCLFCPKNSLKQQHNPGGGGPWGWPVNTSPPPLTLCLRGCIPAQMEKSCFQNLSLVSLVLEASAVVACTIFSWTGQTRAAAAILLRFWAPLDSRGSPEWDRQPREGGSIQPPPLLNSLASLPAGKVQWPGQKPPITYGDARTSVGSAKGGWGQWIFMGQVRTGFEPEPPPC